MHGQARDTVVDGIRIRSYFLGADEEGRRTIVFLHGWGASAESWLPIANAWSDSATRMLLIDLPGFGASDPPRRPAGVFEYRDLIAAVLDQFGIRGAVLIGHSFGGSVAATLAVARPELVSRLVLVDSSGIRNMNRGSRRLIRVIARFVRPLFRARGMQPFRRAIYRLIGSEDYIARPDLQESFRKIVAQDIQPILHRISQPTLIVWGEKDLDTPLAHGRRFAELIAPAKLVVISGAGHYSFLDAPEAFLDALQEFLQKSP